MPRPGPRLLPPPLPGQGGVNTWLTAPAPGTAIPRGTTGQQAAAVENPPLPGGLHPPSLKAGAELILGGLPTRRPPPAPPGDGPPRPREAGSIARWSWHVGSHRNSRTCPTGGPLLPSKGPRLGGENQAADAGSEFPFYQTARQPGLGHVPEAGPPGPGAPRCWLHSRNHCPANWQIQSRHSSLIKKREGRYPDNRQAITSQCTII